MNETKEFDAANKLFNRIETNRENQLKAETKIKELESQKENHVEAVANGDFKAIDKLNAQIEKLKLQAASLIKLINLDGVKLEEANTDINASNYQADIGYKNALAEIETKIFEITETNLIPMLDAYLNLPSRNKNNFKKIIERKLNFLKPSENPKIIDELQGPPPPETQYTIPIPDYVVLPEPEPQPKPAKLGATVTVVSRVIWASKKPNEVALGKKDTSTGEITWNNGAKTRQEAADKAAALHGYSYSIDHSQSKEIKKANQFENLEIKTG